MVHLKEHSKCSACRVGNFHWKFPTGFTKAENTIPKRRETFQSLLCKETLKALMVGGMIYYTYQEGLWSDAFRSSCFLGKFMEKCPKEGEEEDNEYADISNMAVEYSDSEPCQPFIPHSGVMLYNICYVWNQLIIYAFWFVLDAPTEIFDAFKVFLKGKPKPPIEPNCIEAPPP